jgi:hypothetical protein
MGTELPVKVMLGKTLVLMKITFLNNVKQIGSFQNFLSLYNSLIAQTCYMHN